MLPSYTAVYKAPVGVDSRCGGECVVMFGSKELICLGGVSRVLISSFIWSGMVTDKPVVNNSERPTVTSGCGGTPRPREMWISEEPTQGDPQTTDAASVGCTGHSVCYQLWVVYVVFVRKLFCVRQSYWYRINLNVNRRVSYTNTSSLPNYLSCWQCFISDESRRVDYLAPTPVSSTQPKRCRHRALFPGDSY